ncbi:DUF4177 domain-containing protein [Phaeobacter italicus]|mgnify:CR=1 FL=1|uniref:DUF4177 domain-containing protein n=1 Tax=Phaeobacter italicus TaxID=481446 RepID=UPI00232E4002|nr:DUF4177 domain-containing protein [Phaeobacter italicus]MEC8014750.1 DUF4177 domain-containing protein [Pseudomonadota bacterium]
MQAYEYKVIPAPQKGTKAKGVKTPEARFANSIDLLLNEMAAEGWEFQRAELLPSEERSGLTGSVTNWRNVLVFRRPTAEARKTAAEAQTAQLTQLLQMMQAAQPAAAAQADADIAPTKTDTPAAPAITAIAGDPEAPEGAIAVPGRGARAMQSDDGVEELSPVSGVTAALKARASLAGDRKEPPAPAKPVQSPKTDNEG